MSRTLHVALELCSWSGLLSMNCLMTGVITVILFLRNCVEISHPGLTCLHFFIIVLIWILPEAPTTNLILPFSNCMNTSSFTSK